MIKAGALILAAGRGTRMGDLSEKTPKALTPVKGKALLDYAFDRCLQAGLGPVAVNTHHLRHKVTRHLSAHHADEDYLISDEEQLLETGGGVKKALSLLRSDRFAVLNADVICVDPDAHHLARMMRAFDPETMDCLLTVLPLERATGYDGVGDLTALEADMEADSKAEGNAPFAVRLRGEDALAPLVYGGVMITHPSVYDDTPEGAFSNRVIFRKAQQRGRLFAYSFAGPYFHVGTPEGLDMAEDGL